MDHRLGGALAYLSNCGDHNATYGSLGTAIALMTWISATEIPLPLGRRGARMRTRSRDEQHSLARTKGCPPRNACHVAAFSLATFEDAPMTLRIFSTLTLAATIGAMLSTLS